MLRVSSIERSIDWYTSELGLEPERLDEWRRGDAPFPSLRLNPSTLIDLVDEERTGENVSHVCLVVDADLDEAAASGRFEVVEGPASRWGARGSGTALYVRDPDGNVLELRTYP